MSWRSAVFSGLVAVSLLGAACAPPAEEPAVGEWRQFRGPEGLAVSAEDDLPVFWKEGSPVITWKADVPGAGNSSPVVSRGRVFLTTAYGEADDDWVAAARQRKPRRLVLAYDLETGELLWQTVIFQGPVGKRHWSNTQAAPTPVTDGRHVFVSFDAHLAALDFDGNVVWHREVDPRYYEDAHYGVSSSPVLAGDLVILLQDKEEGDDDFPGWIAAFDKKTGEEIWRDEWTHTCCSYNTPLVVERDGRLEVWSQTAFEVNGYDALTGEKIWQGKHKTMQTVPSMVRQGDLFATPGGIHYRSLEVFHLCPAGEDVSPINLWGVKKGSSEMASPVIYGDGRLWSVSKGGALYVHDLLTGTEIWKKRMPSGGEYRSSLVAGDGKVYVTNGAGITTVLDAEAETPTILSRNVLADGSSASPAIAAGSIFIRSRSSLYRIGGRGAAAPAAAPADASGAAEETG